MKSLLVTAIAMLSLTFGGVAAASPARRPGVPLVHRSAPPRLARTSPLPHVRTTLKRGVLHDPKLACRVDRLHCLHTVVPRAGAAHAKP